MTNTFNTMPNNYYNNLRIGHLNVRRLEAHIDAIKLLLDKTKYHLSAVSETKMKASAPVGSVRVPGYNFIKHCRPVEVVVASLVEKLVCTYSKV